ncbi:class I adenylate-forming enzyme family protein [Pseudomonas sp. C2B4]|uniref:class I adenylate-forming enzyme family protein n=1 Tax=Pseudomonas sp. C2B4 TaxID=2735270 RepID=UPI001586EDCB|nr:class I adenylate-forming enzyme family protein [Pseudomonas sp. C2B4]NUU38255.1 acyl--CoA ligase [Pseudomonas sp. C2B4]
MLTREDVLAGLPDYLHQILDRHASSHDDAPALHESGQTLSYGQLREAVVRLAKQFESDGIRAGDRVMLVAENSRLLVASLLALSRLNAWSVVVNARLSAGEIDNIRAHCSARRVLYGSATSKDAAGHAERANAVLRMATHLDSYHLGPLNEDCQPEFVENDPSRQVALMIYTTGTTGAPKGVMLTHRNLLYIAHSASLLRQLCSEDRVYAVLPISHVYGLSAVCLASLFAGAALQLEARFDPQELARALRDDGITLMQGVPTLYARLLELADAGQIELYAPKLRFMYAGGSPLDMTLKTAVEQRFGLTLHNGYGLTESSPTISQTRIDAPRSDTSIGLPIPGLDIRLMNNDRSACVAQGEVGELWVRGPNVMKGYYRAPDKTLEVLTTDGWLNTGDLARQDSDGALFIAGRSKELIIRSGFNVYPPEVEAVIAAFPGVVIAAVVGRPVEGNEEVVAFLQVANREAFDTTALKAFLAERLSPYKRPSHIHLLDSLPATASGKILKHQLKAQAEAL